MKTPESKFDENRAETEAKASPTGEDWSRDLPERGREDLRRLVEFGGGAYDVEAGLSAFEERIARSGSSSISRTLLFGAIMVTGIAGIAGLSMLRAGATTPRAPLSPVGRSSDSTDSLVETPASVVEARPVTEAEDSLPSLPSLPSVAVDTLPTAAPVLHRAAPTTTFLAATPPVKSSPSPVKMDADDLIEAEVRHASKLRIVARTDPGAALSLAGEGDRLFPKGLLHAEREAIAIEALARLERPNEATARAEAFLAANPGHPRTGRIRGISRGERPWER